MLAALHVLISIMGLILIIFLNLLAVFMVLLQLPGTWMMLLCTGLWAWWYWDEQAIGIWTLASLLVLAIIGEVVETFAGVVTSRQAKSSKRSMLLGLVGGIGGAILGTTMIPVPLFGTLIGACIGAGLGAMLGDHWAGRNWKEVKTAGKAAANRADTAARHRSLLAKRRVSTRASAGSPSRRGRSAVPARIRATIAATKSSLSSR